MSRPGPWAWWSMQPFEDNEPQRGHVDAVVEGDGFHGVQPSVGAVARTGLASVVRWSAA